MSMGEIAATIGVDLGKMRDPSAIVVVEELERIFGPTDANSMQDNVRGLESVYRVRHASLCALGTPYREVVDEVAQLVYRPELRRAQIVFDETGVGVGVADIVRERYNRDPRMWHRPIGITITAGTSATRRRVSKSNLVSNLLGLAERGRLEIPDDLPLADKLRQELRDFTLKYTGAGNAKFEADKESQHDDLVMALALALWKTHSHVTPWGLNPDGTTVDRWFEDAA